MARLSEEQISRIKQDVNLLDLVRQQGHKVSKQGKDHVVNCPFHEDKTPSCVISPKNNLFNCFGCGTGGSVIDWVMKTQGLAFREAVVWLNNDVLPLTEPSTIAKAPADLPPLAADFTAPAHPVPAALELPCSLLAEKDEQALLHKVINYYHTTLKQSPEAQDYLKSRGLDDLELIDTFKLGYANRTLGLKLPDKTRKAGAEIRSQLTQIGIYRESGHEHFNGSLVVPVIDEQGKITEVYGRKTIEKLRKGTPKHLYLPGAHQGVFNAIGLNSEDVILCESLIDALTFWRHGFKNVTTSYGIQGFTDELLEAFRQNQIKRVLIAYDMDEAGNAAAEDLAKQLIAQGFDCYRVVLPKGMDVNEYALKVKPEVKSLALVLEQAEPMGTAAPRLQPVESAPSVETVEEETKPDQPQVEEQGDDIFITIETRRYRVRGLNKATSYEQLKINLCSMLDDDMYVDQLDLYNAKQRQHYIKQAALELNLDPDLVKKDLKKLLICLEGLQKERITGKAKNQVEQYNMTELEKEAALELLKDPSLLSRLLQDFEHAGVVGEETNKLVGYLAAVSRKLDNPLAVIIQSTSAAGKSSLMNAVLAMMPEEEKVQYSAMTGQSLFYMGETNLKHKILAIAEEEGAEQASYALKLLQSEGELTIASTGKDADGNLTTQEHHVEGPVMLFSTTTAIDIDEELMNRCIVLTVNESREQTDLIHDLQRERETLEGLLAGEEKKAVLQLHKNAQRLLRPLKVVNPYARQLTFTSSQTRSRRDHMKYLRMIQTVAFLHQYQREIKTVQHQGKTLQYIEVSLEDIAVVNELAHEVLGRSLDELPPQTRKLLGLIYEMVRQHCEREDVKQQDCRFSRRDIREYIGWSDNQLKVHCQRLQDLEYLLIHHGRRGQTLQYELVFDGDVQSMEPQLSGLLNVDALGKHHYDVNKLGLNAKKLASSCPQDGAKLGGSWSGKNQENPINTASNESSPKINGKQVNTGSNQNPESYTPCLVGGLQ